MTPPEAISCCVYLLVPCFTLPVQELAKDSPISIAGTSYSYILLQTQILHLVLYSGKRERQEEGRNLLHVQQIKNSPKRMENFICQIYCQIR